MRAKGLAFLNLVLTAASLKSFRGFYAHFHFKNKEAQGCWVKSEQASHILMPYGYVLRKFFILLGPLFFPFTQASSGVIALTNDLTICFQAAVVGTWHQHLPFPVVHLVGKMGMQSQQNHVSFLAVHLLSNRQLSSVLHSSMVVSC